MKTTRNITKAVVLMSLVTVGVMVVVMKGKVEMSPEGEGKSQGQEVAAVEVLKEGKASVWKEKAPEGLGVVAVEEVPAVESPSSEAMVLAQLRADEVELAYQLGQDLTELTPEGRARLKAEWEARVQQTQQEQASVE
jgi:hypothetical protein